MTDILRLIPMYALDLKQRADVTLWCLCIEWSKWFQWVGRMYTLSMKTGTNPSPCLLCGARCTMIKARTHSFLMPQSSFDLDMQPISIASACQFCHFALFFVSSYRPSSSPVRLRLIVITCVLLWHLLSIHYLLWTCALCVCISMETQFLLSQTDSSSSHIFFSPSSLDY